MANYTVNGDDLTDIADAIIAKAGLSGQLEFPDDFVDGIEGISTGTDVSDTTLTESQALSGYYFYKANGSKVQGSITSQAAQTIHPSTTDQTIASGKYLTGTQTVKGVLLTNLTAGNIKKDVVVKVGDSTDDDCVTSVTGTYEGGGGGGGSTDGDVIFLDYDGTVVDAKTKTEINAMTSDSDLPANPTHTGLTAQGWNWTVAQLKTQLTAMPNQKVYVGQMYVTTSGATEIDVVMHEGRLSPILTIAVNGTVSVDWGDNTTPDTVTGTSTSTRLEVGPHNYASAGNYTITISVTSGSFSFYGSSSYTLLRKNTTSNENRVYANCVKKIRIGTGISKIGSSAFCYCYSLANVTIPSSVTSIEGSAFYYCYSLANVTIPSSVTSIGASAFSSCYSLVNVTIPSSVTSIGSNAFQNCYSLANVTIPSGVTSIGGGTFSSCYSLANVTIPSSVTSIGGNAFYYCYSLANVTIPSGVTSIESQAFYSCYSLANVTIPSGVTSIGQSAFYGCNSLSSITIPSDVTSIGNTAFQNCYGVKEYHILPTTVPTAGTTIFKSIVSDCVIYVPQGKLNDYKAASNWSTYASYMQGE